MIIKDRYSDRKFYCHESTVFSIGRDNPVLCTIRKPFNDIVEILDDNRKRLQWWCLEHVLKHPEIFTPITICEDIGKISHRLGIITKPYEGLKKHVKNHL